jgi:8-oxo-dGTP pyrophosphatase MutT (NUDIX family)
MAAADHFLRDDVGLTASNAVVGLIILDHDRYLMQLRSQAPSIFYPGHWGLFGGAVDPGETAEEALARELREELAVEVAGASYFTEFTFDFGYCGQGKVWRRYYRIELGARAVDNMILGEGSAMQAFAASDILLRPRVVPYDAFAIWMDASTRSAVPGSCR